MNSSGQTFRSYVRGHGIDVALTGAAVVWVMMAVTHRVVALPSLRAVASVQVSLDLLLPGVVAVLVCVATREPIPAVSVTSSRGGPAARLARISIVTLVAVAPAVFLADNAAVVVPRFLFLAAIGLVGVRVLGGRAAWLAPTAYLVAATLVGNNRDATFESWAWVLTASNSPISATLSIGAFLGAAISWSRQPPHRDLW
jgi:hypothetical protein